MQGYDKRNGSPHTHSNRPLGLIYVNEKIVGNQITDVYIITGFSLEPHAVIVSKCPTTIGTYLICPHQFLVPIT